jgi:hypothetical protein
MNKDTGLTQIKDMLQHSAAQALLQDVATPAEPVKNWLGRLALLGDIPFQNLIGDDRLLPQNSLRFFYIDPSWICALIDGALSIGTNTTLEEKITAVLAENIRHNALISANKMRAKLLGIQKAANAPDPEPWTVVAGMLLRSEIVGAFPGLKIIPTYGPGQKQEQIPLRYETLADGLLLVIFPAVPESVTIQQPAQGLRFGFGEHINDKGVLDYTVKLRHIEGTDTGVQLKSGNDYLKGTITDAELLRPDTATDDAEKKYILNTIALKAAIQANLNYFGAYPNTANPISSSQFALQIMSTPEEANYLKPQYQ